MWNFLLSLVTGPLTSISNDLKEAYQSKLNAQNDKERIAADERIALLEARKNSILAAQSNPVERFVRILFAVPVAIYYAKLFVYDKVLALGSTDSLSPELLQYSYVIVGGYFIDSAVKTVFRRK